MEEKLKLSPDSFEPLAKGEAQDKIGRAHV